MRIGITLTSLVLLLSIASALSVQPSSVSIILGAGDSVTIPLNITDVEVATPVLITINSQFCGVENPLFNLSQGFNQYNLTIFSYSNISASSSASCDFSFNLIQYPSIPEPSSPTSSRGGGGVFFGGKFTIKKEPPKNDTCYYEVRNGTGMVKVPCSAVPEVEVESRKDVEMSAGGGGAGQRIDILDEDKEEGKDRRSIYLVWLLIALLFGLIIISLFVWYSKNKEKPSFHKVNKV